MAPFNSHPVVADAPRSGVIILAGGKSSRMGTNKALLPIRGKPNIEKIRDELRRLAFRGEFRGEAGPACRSPYFVIVANEPAVYRFLGEPTVGDRYPGLGPLAGIQAGLQASPCDWNLVVACDMPFVTAEAARFLFGQATGEERPEGAGAGSTDSNGFGDGPIRGVDAVVPLTGGRLHPLFAVYHKRCADPIEELLLAKRLRMVDLLDRLRVKRVTESDFPDSVDTERVFFNMNRPEEWQQAQQWLETGRRGNE